MDKNILPPIKSKNNHDDPPTPTITTNGPRSPKRLPKLEGRPPTSLPFDPILTQGPIHESINEEENDLNSFNGSLKEDSKSIDSAAKKYLANDDEVLAQNEENKGWYYYKKYYLILHIIYS